MQKDYTLNEINNIAKQILKQAGHAKCLAFFAPMGAGKTTLINAICKELEVIDNVSSPTYSIINEYKTSSGETIVHMDWYRLKDENDAINTGVEDYLLHSTYCLVEWPERAEALLPENYMKIKIEVLADSSRRIEY